METYRPATKGDLNILILMNQQLIEDERDTIIITDTEMHQYFKDWIGSPQYEVTVAENGQKEIIAYAVCRDDGEFTYLRHFFVSRTSRRDGVGSRLLAELTKVITPAKPIRLNVLHQNRDAQKFYDANRFRVFGFTPTTMILEKRYS